MPEGFTDEQLSAALEALSDPGRFREIESRVAAAAPQLQQVLAAALAEGGWFDSAHEQRLAAVAALEDPAERLTHFRTLLAEEARMGMLVGVAVGWELGRELRGSAAIDDKGKLSGGDVKEMPDRPDEWTEAT